MLHRVLDSTEVNPKTDEIKASLPLTGCVTNAEKEVLGKYGKDANHTEYEIETKLGNFNKVIIDAYESSFPVKIVTNSREIL